MTETHTGDRARRSGRPGARPGTGQTMAAVSHSNDADPRNVFSEMFRRGQTTHADGGTARKREETDDAEMKDVDHEGSTDADASRVWKRGNEDGEE